MRWRLTVASALGAAVIAAAQAPARVGGTLKEGMRLHYVASVGAPSLWLVGRVESAPAERAGAECARFVVQRGAAPSAADSAHQCVSGDTLFTISRTGAWTVARPVGPNMTIELKRATATNTLVTGAAAVDTIDGIVIPVVITTYTFGGPNGIAVSQLRERYAVSLGTATRGAFYEPDPGVGDGWKLQRTFTLTKIERP